MKHFSLFKNVFIILIPILLFGQNNQNELQKLSYQELWSVFFKGYNNNNIQIEYAKEYLKKAEKEQNEVEKGRGYYLLAVGIYEKHEKQSFIYFKKALFFAKKTNDKYIESTVYFDIAGIFQKQLKFKEAVNNYILAEKSNTDIDFSYILKLNIAVIKSEYLGEIDEALQLYKECYTYYIKNGIRNPKYNSFYQEILFDIADAFKAKKMIDSATHYNKLGIIEAQFSKDEQMKYLFTLNEGANQVLNKNYKTALDSINKAFPIMLKYKNKGNTLAAYYYLGKVYEGMNNESFAVKNYQSVDSMYLINKKITPEFVGGYSFLISYYKKKDDKVNQLKYITRFMSIDSAFQRNYKDIYKTIQNEYTIPNLLSDKESVISSLRKDKNYSYWIFVSLLLIIIVIGIFGIKQYKQKKLYRQRFEKIISKTNLDRKNESDINTSLVQQNEDIGIAKEVISKIIERLNDFEFQNQYLQNNITIQSLSEEFETNNKYLSKIIKKYKKKPFIQYINDLRIEYAINQLQTDKKLRNYTIIALTKEFGFNSTESFTTAFAKRTGIKPIYFIKQLEKQID